MCWQQPIHSKLPLMICWIDYTTAGASTVARAGTILVVDDEPKIVDIVRAYLQREGYHVLVAYDGREALAASRRERPDLLVLDLMLPELSGWDVCRRLRAESAMPIIMLTARHDTTD